MILSIIQIIGVFLTTFFGLALLFLLTKLRGIPLFNIFFFSIGITLVTLKYLL